jgi:GMP reductase
MASSHNLKEPNGDPNLSPQEKSIEVKMVDGRDIKMNQHVPKQESNTDQIEESNRIENTIVYPAFIKKTQIDESKNEDHFRLANGIMKYDFEDVLIIPKSQTNLNSRYKDVNPYYINEFGIGRLPLFTAPMDTVVGHDNAHEFSSKGINVVLPRTINKKAVITNCFKAYGFNDYPCDSDLHQYVLLDVANGHMSKVIEWCTTLKKRYPDVKIMAGNIANPKTYYTYCSSGVIDYARIGIGNGNGCLTTQQTGVGYPMASLIAECYEIRIRHKNPIKIVADGGMKDYSDIIKALALGADYVMVGSIFAKALESSAPSYWYGIKLNQGLAENMYNKGFKIQKEFRGMSTKAAQKALGNEIIKTSEGIVRKLNVEYTLEQWVENFEHYLRSAMSYSNANTLLNFIGQVDHTLISNNSLKRFKK